MRPLLSLLACAALLAGCGSSANKATGDRVVEPVVLTLANWQGGDADVGAWAQAVQRLSGGSVRIDIRGLWRAGDADVMGGTVEDVRAGRVDLATLPARAWDTLGVGSLRALEAPLLVDSLELERRVVTGDVGTAMLDGIRAAGVVPLALIPGPLRRPVGITRDVRGPADLRGAFVGLQPSATHEATFRALGARIAPLSPLARLSGVDASELDVAALDLDGFAAEARSMTADVVLWARPTTVVANRDAWEALDDEQRDAVLSAGRAAAAVALRRERDWERGGARSMCDRGFPFVRAGANGLAAVRRGVQPVLRRLARDEGTRRAMERIEAMKRTVTATPALACAPERRRGAPIDSPLVGTWEIEVTPEQLAAARRMPGEEVEPNSGTWKLELRADGAFALRLDRDPGSTPGTWTVRRDTLTMVPGGSIGQGAGETWRYRWTVFRDELTLRRLADGPTSLTVAPLRRR